MRLIRVDRSPDAAALAAAKACVEGGGTLIFPTDTVYGIGCAAENELAIASIFASKDRPHDRPLSIHIADPRFVESYALRLSPAARAAMRHFWPGPLTVIVTRRPSRGEAAARGGSTIGIRCPDDPVYRAIVEATGPLAATSANISGAPAYTGYEDDVTSLPDATIALIAGPTRRLRESTVLDCSGERARIVRSGAVDPSHIAQALAGIAPVEN